MPHRTVRFAPWVEDLSEIDPCLGRIVKEAEVARDAALEAGAATVRAPRSCRAVFRAGETTIAALRDGRVAPGTPAAWKRATDAVRKFTQALDCVAPVRR
jgi:hypothetical protein